MREDITNVLPVPPRVPVVETAAAEEAKPPVKLSNLPAILWRRLWVIAVCLVVALVAGIIYLRQATPVYKATTKLFVTSLNRNQITGDNPDVQTLQGSRNYRGTQVEILLSPLVLRRVADRPDIKAMKTFDGAGDIVGILRANLDVGLGNDDLMNISFNTPQWGDAAPVANAVADAYIAFSDDYKRNSSSEVLQILQREKTKLEDEISQRVAMVTKLKTDSGGLALATRDKEGNTVLQGSLTLKQLDTFAEAMTKAQIDAVEAKASLESIANLKNDPKRLRRYMDTQRARGAAMAINPDEQRLRDELSQLYQARSEMAGKLGPDHPRYQGVIERIDVLERELQKYDQLFVESQISMAQEAFNAAQRRVNELAEYIRANGEDAKKLNTQVAQYERLTDELQQAKARLDFLNARIREMDMSQDVRAMNVMLVEAAAEPLEPASPNKSKTLKMCLAFGLILGLCGAMALEFLDDRMRSSEQMTTATGLPILGVIPEVLDPKAGDIARFMEQDPNSAMAESIRSLRTAILFGVPEGRAKTIMITSPTPGDGKSTTAAALAESLAQSGKKTLLLDTDLRKPRVETIFHLNRENGLTSVVTGQATLDVAIQKGPIPNLDLIGCGPIPPNPAELLNSDAFRTLINTLSQRYDHIVLDTPPVLLVTDSRMVSAMADVTILVLRADVSRQRLANHAKECLLSVGGRILGLVVNAAPERRNRYSLGTGYGYGRYGYSYGGYGGYGSYSQSSGNGNGKA